MNNFRLLFFAVLLFVFGISDAQPYLPVNKKASPEAKNLLAYLYSISGKYILSGQHNYNHEPNRYSDSAFAFTGKQPAVWGTDFIWNGMEDPGQRIVGEAIKKWKEGTIITLMWHQGRPTDNPPYGWKESIQGKLTDAEWKELITPGTKLYKKWLAQIDVIAGYLKQLRDAQVPVLWRPYHEMNGVWFWWGNKKGNNGIVKLWQMMYDRFTNYHQLNNLVWVWGANGPRDIPGDEAYSYKDFYPGHKYVDVLGTDVYHSDYEQKDYQELVNLAQGRPIALTEVGTLPSDEVLKAQPKWTWFLVWTSWLWTDNTRQRVEEVYNNKKTLTQDEIKLFGRNVSEASSKQSDNLPVTALKSFGRSVININKDLELISSAVHFGFSFEGSECKVYASVPEWLDHNYLQYELDGVYQKRLRISSKTSEPIVFTAPSNGKHTIWIYKATEAQTGPIFIQKVSGKNIKSLESPKVPLIEFIGNSITCGAAADPSEIQCGSGVYHDQHNAYMAYGPRVARTLGTNYILSSVSGIGIYRNWNSDGPTMPQVYEKVDFQEQSSNFWDFKTYTPQIVSIALGTNDLSKGDGQKERLPFDSARFVNTYIKFVQLVKSKYPSARIALLSSPMENGEARILLQNCLQAVKDKVDALYPSAKSVELFFFSPMQARGCYGHPNVEDHAIMANELLPFFKRLLQ